MLLALPPAPGEQRPRAEEDRKQMQDVAGYTPQFWIFSPLSPEHFGWARELGFCGVGFWAADRDGDRIKYYFTSPTLERVDWASREGDRLSAYAAKAHAAHLKVMVNMEGVNPYHWEAGREKWTPDIISGVARDLHEQGADRWFTECVAGWPHLMKALADTGREIGMDYQEGSDPTYLHGYDSESAGSFPELYRQPSVFSMYHYHYRRDEMGRLASLAQEGSVGYGFARSWGRPCALVYSVAHDWGELPENWEGILKATILIRALQFRVRDVMAIGVNEDKARALDPTGTTEWVQALVTKNAQESRPVLNVVVHLRRGPGSHWRDFASSGDAITSGAFHAGYDVVCTTAATPDADAYYIYTTGADAHGTLDLTDDIVQLLDTGKPVFLQVGSRLPSGDALTRNWRRALSSCGVDATAQFTEVDMPAGGVYNNTPFRYTGVYSAYELTQRRHGTRLPTEAVTGDVLATGDGVPLIVGSDRHYLIPANCLSWQAMYPISHLLSGHGVRASSDVWGIVGERVTALLATHDTDHELTIPGVAEGAEMRVTQWDRHHRRVYEDVVRYSESYSRKMNQFDLVVIESVAE